jgi:non-heme chloroperoxidase
MPHPKIGLLLPLLLAVAVANASGQQKQTAQIVEGFAKTTSGMRIHYLQTGEAKSTRALVLIPGWRLPASLWNGQLKTFASMTRVTAVDPRSQGASTRTSDGNTPETRARDLHDVLANLGVSRSVLVGWSQGAQDVAAYLQQFGTDSVAGVVLVDSPVSAGPGEIDVHREFAKTVLSGISVYASHPHEYSEGMVRSLFKKPHPDLDLQKLVNSTLQTPTDVGVAMLVADIFGADRRPALAKLSIPALVIASADSPLLDAQKEMASTIPGSKFVTIAGTGHAVFVDDPATFNDALRTFVQSLGQW